MTEAALRLAFDNSSFLCFKLMYEIRVVVVVFFISDHSHKPETVFFRPPSDSCKRQELLSCRSGQQAIEEAHWTIIEWEYIFK